MQQSHFVDWNQAGWNTGMSVHDQLDRFQQTQHQVAPPGGESAVSLGGFRETSPIVYQYAGNRPEDFAGFHPLESGPYQGYQTVQWQNGFNTHYPISQDALDQTVVVEKGPPRKKREKRRDKVISTFGQVKKVARRDPRDRCTRLVFVCSDGTEYDSLKEAISNQERITRARGGGG